MSLVVRSDDAAAPSTSLRPHRERVCGDRGPTGRGPPGQDLRIRLCPREPLMGREMPAYRAVLQGRKPRIPALRVLLPRHAPPAPSLDLRKGEKGRAVVDDVGARRPEVTQPESLD